MNSNALKNHAQLLSQFITFKTVMILTNLIVWSYYYILLFEETGSFSILLLENLIYLIGLGIGFFICTFFIDRTGYLASFKFSAILQAISMLLILAYIHDLATLFPLFAVIRGLGHGWYWPIEHLFNLKELHGAGRGRLISLMESLNLMLQIVVPILAGALISFTNGYQMTFAVGGIIYLATLFLPFDYNQKSNSRISSKEITAILKMKNFIPFALLSFLMAGSMSLFNVMWLIIPYLLLKEEFSVGVLGSIVGLIAALTAWMDSKFSFKTRLNLGYFGFVIYTVFTFLMGLMWSIPFLVFRSMAVAFTNSVGTPARADLDYRIREKILKDYKNESALEMNMIVEIIYTLARIVFLTAFILIFSAEDTMAQSEEKLKVLVILFSPIMLFVYGGFVWLNAKTKVY